MLETLICVRKIRRDGSIFLVVGSDMFTSIFCLVATQIPARNTLSSSRQTYCFFIKVALHIEKVMQIGSSLSFIVNIDVLVLPRRSENSFVFVFNINGNYSLFQRVVVK